jgi:hypothetical protein
MSDEERVQERETEPPAAEDVEAIEIDDKLLKRLVDDLSPRLAEALKAQLAPDAPAQKQPQTPEEAARLERIRRRRRIIRLSL